MQLAKNLQKFRLITFDITGTLLQFRADPVVIYKEKALKYGLNNIDEEKLRKCYKKHFKETAKKYPNFGANSKNMTWENWWHQLVKETFRCVDPEIDDHKLNALAEELVNVFRTSETWSLTDCGTSLVEKIRETGKCIGVISNFDPSLKTVLNEMKMGNLFDFVLTSYEAKAQKPERQIFDLALERVNAGKEDPVEPDEALHIGNSFELDFIGATKNAGWSSLLIAEEDRSNLFDIEKRFVYPNICDMLKALETKEIQWKC